MCDSNIVFQRAKKENQKIREQLEKQRKQKEREVVIILLLHLFALLYIGIG